MAHENPPIETMMGLLAALFVDAFGSRKVDARVKSYRKEEANVWEYFDSGKGHSGAFSDQRTPLKWGIFVEAQEAQYISGVLEPGYVSTTDFKLTDLGKKEFFSLLRAQEAAKEEATVQTES